MPPKKQNQFKLKDFMGVDPEHITKLEKYGIKICGQMLSAGQTGEERVILAS